MTRVEVALAGGFEGAVAVLSASVLAIAGAVAFSPLAPVEPVRQFDPSRGVQFDVTVLFKWRAPAALGPAGLSWPCWLGDRYTSPWQEISSRALDDVRAAAALGVPTVSCLATPSNHRRVVVVVSCGAT